MATVKVVNLINRASIILQDTSNVRYPQAELLKFFNDAQREVVMQRPDANMLNVTMTCVAGSKQSIPSSALRLIDVVRNVDGRSVTQMSRKMLDEQLPDWHETTAGSNGIEHFVYEPADPKNFYVYPKGTSSHNLEIIYSEAPADISITNFSTATTVISVDDVYANAILDYMLYRAYQKDSEYAGNQQKSTMHYQGFANSLGVKTQADMATTPAPANPDINTGRV